MTRLLASATAAIVLATILVAPVAAKDAPRIDDFDRAKEVTELPFARTVDVKRATRADDDPTCRDTGHTVWFKFTPSTDMRLIARVRGKKTAAAVSVWTGERGALTDVECNEYRPILEAEAGTTYYFMVGTFRNRRGGEIRFRLTEAPPPPTIELIVDPGVTVNSQSEEVTVSGTVSCTNSSYMNFYGAVKQLSDNREFISAWFYEYGPDCSETPVAWSLTDLGDGVFIDGPAFVDIEAYSCSRIECIEEEEIFNVTIQRQ